jgi:hypothetical protein
VFYFALGTNGGTSLDRGILISITVLYPMFDFLTLNYRILRLWIVKDESLMGVLERIFDLAGSKLGNG